MKNFQLDRYFRSLPKKQMDKVCALYYEAANYFEDKSDIEAACFFTHKL